jgi:hypothetical protein
MPSRPTDVWHLGLASPISTQKDLDAPDSYGSCRGVAHAGVTEEPHLRSRSWRAAQLQIDVCLRPEDAVRTR